MVGYNFIKSIRAILLKALCFNPSMTMLSAVNFSISDFHWYLSEVGQIISVFVICDSLLRSSVAAIAWMVFPTHVVGNNDRPAEAAKQTSFW